MTRFLSALLLVALVTGCAQPPRATQPLRVQVVALNDFHGYLQPPAPFQPGDQSAPVAVGGAPAVGAAVKALQAGRPHSIFVAAGDLIGASPLLSALFHDEPTIESLNLMGLQASAVGNHEFDRGATELLRRQNGGCHPQTGCRGPAPFAGARFQYLAASTVDTATGKPLLPASLVRRFDGIPVAFIGLTLKGTPGLVMPSGVAGLRFEDEADAINRQVRALRQEGIEAIVVLIHEGGYTSGGPNECPNVSGPILDIVRRTDRAVDLFVTGHTHRAYNCVLDGRRVTSGDKYGSMLTDIELVIDRRTGDVVESSARNVLTAHSQFSPDPAQQALVDTYRRLVRPLTERVVGHLSAAVSTQRDALGSSPMGQLVADAHLEATRTAGAQLAFTNTCGVRAGLGEPGPLRYEQLFSAQPFGNELITLTLSGAEFRALLESQWRSPRLERPCGRLQHSASLRYAVDLNAPPGERIRDLRLDNQPLALDTPVRLTVNRFVQTGGDGFVEFAAGRDLVTGPIDVDALEAFVQAQGTVHPPALDRVRRAP